MNLTILVVIVAAIVGSIVLTAVAKEFRHAFQVPEGYALPQKSGKASSPENKPEDGAS